MPLQGMFHMRKQSLIEGVSNNHMLAFGADHRARLAACDDKAADRRPAQLRQRLCAF